MPPAACCCGNSGAVSSEAVNLLPLVSQPVSPAAATGAAHCSPSMGHWGLHLAARSCAHRTHAGFIRLFLIGLHFCDSSFEGTFLEALFSFRNFHLWFANMGSSCGFSRGNVAVVLLLLLLDGKRHHQLYCLSHAEEAQDEVGNHFNICCTVSTCVTWKYRDI